MANFGSFARLGGGSRGAGGSGGEIPPVDPYEVAISGTSGTITQATHGQSTTPTVQITRDGEVVDLLVSINGSGDVTWYSEETFSGQIVISG